MPELQSGQDWPELRETYSRERIGEYARAGGDLNPIHTDDDFARAVGLPSVIAHGLLSMAGLARAVTSRLEDPSQLRELSTRFSGMVLPDQAITFRGTVTAVHQDGLELELWAENPAGERVLNRARAVISTHQGESDAAEF